MARKTRHLGKRFSKRRFWLTVTALGLVGVVVFYAAVLLTVTYFDFSRRIDERLRGSREERSAWVLSRPLEIRPGQRLPLPDLIDLLNALRYQQRQGAPEQPGTFQIEGKEIRIHLRRGSPAGRSSTGGRIRIGFRDQWIREMETWPGARPLSRIELGPVPVTKLFSQGRVKQRWVPLRDVPKHLVDAVVATEDRRFFDHTGLDPLGILRAALADLNSQDVRQGGSTLTQQLVKNYFLTPERTLRRKLLEAFLAIILETKATKEQILELYLNDVYLGQKGSFGINGVGQAARVYFGKDVGNLDIEESALIAGLIRSPNTASPFQNPERALARRNLVLTQMAEIGLLRPEVARAATERRLGVVQGAVDASEVPYFIDTLRADLLSRYSPESLQQRDLSVLSTLDDYLQHAALVAIEEGLQEIEKKLPGSTGKDLQAALVAMDPESGEILALVGGRSYGLSQFNRAVEARRQPGSAFKPFVFLAAFERTHALLRSSSARSLAPSELSTPATRVVDEPTTFRYGGRTWSPQNYDRRFGGAVTYREALARSLNVATAKVGERVGFQRVVDLWQKLGMSGRIEPYPSVVLGTFEVTPMELATAYAVLANRGIRVEPHLFREIRDARGRVLDALQPVRRRVVQAETAFLVAHILQSVIDEGTGREVRARGLKVHAAGKTGTTDDTRDAWFVGFVPDLLAVVWVGYDGNRRLGLSGSQAALPIWTRFMKAATSGLPDRNLQPPAGITVARIDVATGHIATASCPRVREEVFLTGTEPRQVCSVHR